MYDDFSADYDRFVSWPERLAAELPFIVGRVANPSYILDAACGTGMHAIALAQRGYKVVGADLSAGMIAQARENAAAAGVDVGFEVAGFGDLAEAFGPSFPTPAAYSSLPSPRQRRKGEGEGIEGFDAVLCLGNSLPHVLTADGLIATLADFAACLRPGGLLLIQNRNFDAVLNRGERWLSSQAHREGETEWLFLRFYDFETDGTLAFNVVTLRREGHDDWSQQVVATRLWPLRQEELVAALQAVGFEEIAWWGDMQGAPFDAGHSPNLVATGRVHAQAAEGGRLPDGDPPKPDDHENSRRREF